MCAAAVMHIGGARPNSLIEVPETSRYETIIDKA